MLANPQISAVRGAAEDRCGKWQPLLVLFAAGDELRFRPAVELGDLSDHLSAMRR